MRGGRRKHWQKRFHGSHIALMVVEILISRAKEQYEKAETDEEVATALDKLDDLGNFKHYLELEIEKLNRRCNKNEYPIC